jgi:hypothetical protein
VLSEKLGGKRRMIARIMGQEPPSLATILR